MTRLLPIIVAAGACTPTLTNGRYQTVAAKAADVRSANADWSGAGDEMVTFEVGYSVWLTHPERQGCPPIGMTLRHGHHEARWPKDAPLVIEGSSRQVLEEPEYRLSERWDKVSARTPKAALQALVDGGWILIGENRYPLDASVREAIAELLKNHRCKQTDDRAATGSGPVPVEPLEPADPCADFERRQKNAVSAQEHQRGFGCPPCPCACHDGEIVCAPCAACESFGPLDTEVLEVPVGGTIQD